MDSHAGLANRPIRRRAAAEPSGSDRICPAPAHAQPQFPGWSPTRLLHRGGLLVHYRARPAADVLGPGCYVLKAPRPEGGDPRLAAACLAREVRLAAEVGHAHLQTVLAAGAGPQPFAVLPYCEGITLRQLMTACRTSDTIGRVSHALWIVRQIAAALAALHAAGWLHGQVRPGHAIVSPQGHVTLIDLGLARREGSAECAADPATRAAPAYAAAEAFRSSGLLTAASDVYSLGIVLFELLAGQPPFAATNERAWAACHRGELPPDVRRANVAVSRDAAQLVRQMLAKEPLRRPTAAELVDRLAGLEIEDLL